jgi:hypothetical protein
VIVAQHRGAAEALDHRASVCLVGSLSPSQQGLRENHYLQRSVHLHRREFFCRCPWAASIAPEVYFRMLLAAYLCHVKTITGSNPVAPEPILSVDLILRVLGVPRAAPASRATRSTGNLYFFKVTPSHIFSAMPRRYPANLLHRTFVHIAETNDVRLDRHQERRK